jgi:hypothetical protein
VVLFCFQEDGTIEDLYTILSSEYKLASLEEASTGFFHHIILYLHPSLKVKIKNNVVKISTTAGKDMPFL